MKKLLLVLTLTMVGLSGCYVRGYDDGHRRDRDQHEDNGRHKGQDDHRDERGGEHDNRYK